MASPRIKNIKVEVPEKIATSRLRKTIYLLPNSITAANMVLGIWSITWAIKDSLTLSMFPAHDTIPLCHARRASSSSRLFWIYLMA